MKHNKKFNRIELLAITLVPNLMPFKVNAMKKNGKEINLSSESTTTSASGETIVYLQNYDKTVYYCTTFLK